MCSRIRSLTSCLLMQVIFARFKIKKEVVSWPDLLRKKVSRSKTSSYVHSSTRNRLM